MSEKTMKINIALTAFAITALTWFGCEHADAQGSRSKPNVILIMTDDQGYGDLACLGNPWIDSPNLDNLYAESIRLTDFHVSPMCSPTRAALLTGRHCRHVGVRQTNNCTNLIASDVPTMADVFAQNGYRTGMFGKWHLGETYPYRPHDRGFHEAVYHGNGAIGTTGDVWGNDYFDDVYHHNGEPKKYSGYCTDVFFQEASRFIRENHERGAPFFCYLAPNVVHGPMLVADEYFLRYRDAKGVFSVKTAKMYGMVANLDENMGRLMRLLESESLARDTILIFMTDNGTAAGAALDKQGFVKAGYNAGMRGKKTSSYDGGHRVPCFVRWPGGGLGGGKDVSELTAHLDVLPTLMELCGLQYSSELHGDGVSLRPLLEGKGEKWPDRTIVESFNKVVMTKRWRLVHNTELYDVIADPEQRHDVAQQHPEVVQRLQAALAENARGEDTRQQRIVLGSDQAPKVSLTIEQWLDEDRTYRTFRTALILHGELFESTVPVEIAVDGRYRITLRRWPEQVKTPICGAIKGGRALKITQAGVELGSYSETEAVNEQMQSVSFTTDLAAGDVDLRAWFITEEQQRLGAYFVDVERLE
jgi:arylsulfatase A-like enzyme